MHSLQSSSSFFTTMGPFFFPTTPRKAACVSMGIIFAIGSAVASGVFFSYLGYSALAFLVMVPIGMAMILCTCNKSIKSTLTENLVVKPWEQQVLDLLNKEIDITSSKKCLILVQRHERNSERNRDWVRDYLIKEVNKDTQFAEMARNFSQVESARIESLFIALLVKKDNEYYSKIYVIKTLDPRKKFDYEASAWSRQDSLQNVCSLLKEEGDRQRRKYAKSSFQLAQEIQRQLMFSLSEL